jgi:UDP-glucose:glycoprotein glucosyltransferase
MDVPQSWLVRPRESIYDLDNIYLASLTGSDRATGVQAVFDLDFLVIEGHARDTTTGYPPRGLQLQLTKGDEKIRTPIADTQVVENLGYLQFKATPGVFQMEIREGRGQEVYHMESVGNAGWNSPGVDDVGLEVTVTSFEGLTLYPRFTRQAGQLDAEVLTPKSKGVIPGLFDKVVTR